MLAIILFDIFVVIMVSSISATPLKDVFSWNYIYHYREFIYFSNLRIIKYNNEPLDLKDCFKRFAGLLLSVMTLFIYDIIVDIKGENIFLQDIFSKTYLIKDHDRGKEAKI
jgi:hypothetical protein